VRLCTGVGIWNSLLMTLGAAAAYNGNGGGLLITSSPDIQDCVFKLLAVRAAPQSGQRCAHLAGGRPSSARLRTGDWQWRRRVGHGRARHRLAARVLLSVQRPGRLRMVHAHRGPPCWVRAVCAVDERQRASDVRAVHVHEQLCGHGRRRLHLRSQHHHVRLRHQRQPSQPGRRRLQCARALHTARC